MASLGLSGTDYWFEVQLGPPYCCVWLLTSNSRHLLCLYMHRDGWDDARRVGDPGCRLKILLKKSENSSGTTYYLNIRCSHRTNSEITCRMAYPLNFNSKSLNPNPMTPSQDLDPIPRKHCDSAVPKAAFMPGLAIAQ